MAIPLHDIQKLTYEDYALIPEDGQRHEILDGDHVMSPAPRTRHQRIVGTLFAELRRHARRHGLGEVFIAPFDVVLSESDIVQPDICFVADARLGIVDEENCKGAPDLVAEVLSESTRRRDLVEKRLLFERSGVAEYWAVDPETRSVQVFRRDGDRFTRQPERFAEAGDALDTPLIPGLALGLTDLFA